jgi:hypothetical protein
VSHFVCRTIKFDKCLNTLHRAGGAAAIAAKKADAIIDRLVLKGCNNFNEIGKPTKHGELRIKSCRKYDLGGGYRLVFVKQGYHLVLLYVGAHDDCDRWLSNNRGLPLIIEKESHKISTIFSSLSLKRHARCGILALWITRGTKNSFGLGVRRKT